MVETQIVSYLNGQLTPDLMSQIQMPQVLMAVGGLMIVIAFTIFIISFMSKILKALETRKSLEYRQLLTDMYVVGMVKKFAVEDGIDLVKELKDFAKIERKKKLSWKAIDEVIEDNLKEKIDAKTEKEIDKIENHKEK